VAQGFSPVEPAFGRVDTNAEARSVCLPAGTDAARTRPAGRRIGPPHGDDALI